MMKILTGFYTTNNDSTQNKETSTKHGDILDTYLVKFVKEEFYQRPELHLTEKHTYNLKQKTSLHGFMGIMF